MLLNSTRQSFDKALRALYTAALMIGLGLYVSLITRGWHDRNESGRELHVSPTSSHSLAAKLAELAELDPDTEISSDDARHLLEQWTNEQSDLASFITRKGTRLPNAQQHALLRVLQSAEDTNYVPALTSWTTHTALSLSTRAMAMVVLESLGAATDTPSYKILQEADTLYRDLGSAAPPPLTESNHLSPPWSDRALNLPFALALDLARDLTATHPHLALALLHTLRPIVDGKDRLALVDRLSSIPSAESAAMLQEILAEATDKTSQKAIKKALHRLKAQGVDVSEVQNRARAVIGTVTHRLEQCLASHVDSAGDRVFWMVRTKSFGGYNVAYVVINYGTGIQYAVGMPVSKRDLPEILAKAQERAPLVDVDPSYGQFQIAQAHRMNLETNTPVPDDFFSVRDIVGEPTTTFDQAIIYSALSEEDLQEAQAYEHHAADLLELPEFAGWTLPKTIIQKYGDELRSLEESQIVVSEAIQRQRTSAVYERATSEVLGDKSRQIMRLRLEEMAHYLLGTDRRLQALWAVASARSLEIDNPDRLSRNPFVSALFERSIEAAKRHASSNIIMPFSAPNPPASATEDRRIII